MSEQECVTHHALPHLPKYLGELGPAHAPNAPDPVSSLRSLRRVAERMSEWGGGLAPLADTRCDGTGTLPARQDFDLRLADLRTAAQSTS